MTGTIAPIGVGTATLVAMQTTAGSMQNMLVAPGNTNPPIVFEPPAALSGGTPQVWLIATGGADWGGCQVWISSDGTTYALAGTLYAGGRQGTLTAALPSHADPDRVDTLSVDLTESAGQLLSGTQADADNFVTLCYCDGELLSYETATLTAQYKYNLTYLRRGILGSGIRAHAAGAPFARFGPNDPALFKYGYPAGFVGTTVYLKLPAFNTFGEALQSLASVAATTFVLAGTGSNLGANPIWSALAAGQDVDLGAVPGPLSADLDLDLGGGPANSAIVLGDIDLGLIPGTPAGLNNTIWTTLAGGGDVDLGLAGAAPSADLDLNWSSPPAASMVLSGDIDLGLIP